MLIATAAAVVYVAVVPDVPERSSSAASPPTAQAEWIPIATVGVDASPPAVVTEGGAVVVTAPPPPPDEAIESAAMTVEPWPPDVVLAALRMCESTNRYGVNTGNGYYGAYQFDQPTWNATAARHASWLIGVRPHLASPADQDQMARWLWQERGAQPWPTCGPRAGRLM